MPSFSLDCMVKRKTCTLYTVLLNYPTPYMVQNRFIKGYIEIQTQFLQILQLPHFPILVYQIKNIYFCNRAVHI